MAEDLSCFFSDDLITTDVVFGAVSTKGILDQTDEVIGNNTVISTNYELLVNVSDFPTDPVYGDEIEVGGEDYKVTAYQKIFDGKVARIGLAKV